MSDMDPIVPCDAEAFTVHLDDRTGTWTRTTSHLPGYATTPRACPVRVLRRFCIPG